MRTIRRNSFEVKPDADPPPARAASDYESLTFNRNGIWHEFAPDHNRRRRNAICFEGAMRRRRFLTAGLGLPFAGSLSLPTAARAQDVRSDRRMIAEANRGRNCSCAPQFLRHVVSPLRRERLNP